MRSEKHAPPTELPSSAWWALAYLVVPGSLGVFGLFVYVLRYWDASIASFQLVLIPLVAVPAAAWIDDESITGIFIVGAGLVLAGTFLALAQGTSMVGGPATPPTRTNLHPERPADPLPSRREKQQNCRESVERPRPIINRASLSVDSVAIAGPKNF